MANLRVDISIASGATTNKLGAIERQLTRGAIRTAINKALAKAAKQAEATLVGKTVTAVPAKPGGQHKGAVASGAFVKAWEIIPDRPSMSISIINKKIYGAYVEKGVKSGEAKIPMSPLVLDMFEKWIRDRGIQPTRYPGQSTRKFARFLIWRINKRTGVRFNPRGIIKESRARVREIFRNRLHEELDRATAEAAKAAK